MRTPRTDEIWPEKRTPRMRTHGTTANTEIGSGRPEKRHGGGIWPRWQLTAAGSGDEIHGDGSARAWVLCVG